MRVMVAGGAGFVGSHLSRALLESGRHVVVVDDLSTGNFDNIVDLVGHPGFEFIRSDVAHAPAIHVDVIAHLASPASPVDYDRMPIHTMSANALGMYRLLDIANTVGARLLFVSTSEVYGDPLVHPQPETYWGNVDPVGPRSCYDEAKRFGEALLFAARRERGTQANVVRLFNTYGPSMRRDDGRVIPEMVSAALMGRPLTIHGNGSQTRSFCYISDLVAGLIHVIGDSELDGEIFNLGNPHEITVSELSEHVIELTGSSSEIHYTSARPGDPERRRPIIDKIQSRYGWEPRVHLREGIGLTIDAFRRGTAREQARTNGAEHGRRSIPVDIATVPA
jgi:nucleoside-diphosphate-sugar epimerase